MFQRSRSGPYLVEDVDSGLAGPLVRAACDSMAFGAVAAVADSRDRCWGALSR